MAKWEYDLTIEELAAEKATDDHPAKRLEVIAGLNARGAEGWELVQQESHQISDKLWVWRVWKRQIG